MVSKSRGGEWAHYYVRFGSTYLQFLFLSSVFHYLNPTAAEFGFSFIKWPSWEIVAPGQEIHLYCSTNLASDSIEWHHNHRHINSSRTRYSGDLDLLQHITISHGVDGSRLSLKVSENEPIYKQQQGLYQCVATVGSISITSLPGRIEVAFLSKSSSGESFDLSVSASEGEPFRISCNRPDSLPEAKMSYYKNGALLDTSRLSEYYVSPSGDLIVLKATYPSSEGIYSCSSFNEVLQKTMTTMSVSTVKVKSNKNDLTPTKPFILTFQPLYIVTEGDSVRLLCLTFGNPEPKIWWALHDSFSPPTYSLSNDSSSLVISKVSSSDEGIYRCYANNTEGETSFDITLVVHAPPHLVEGAENKHVSEGEKVSLSCVFQGRPIPTVAWVFNGKLLRSSKDVIVSGSQLELQIASRTHAGIYQCFAFNLLGAAEGTAVLTVIPKTIPEEALNHAEDNNSTGTSAPFAPKKKTKKKDKSRSTKKDNFVIPTKPNITKMSDDSVLVTWDVKPKGGLAILFFKVQYRVISGPTPSVDKNWKTVDEDIPPHIKSFEVVGLKANHTYRFRIAAVYVNNDSKLGASSKKFLLKTSLKLKRPSEAPIIVDIRPTEESNSAFVSWSYNNTDPTEGFVINYRETTSAAQYTKTTLLGDRRRNFTIDHLKSNVDYDFKMCSFNMAGASKFSSVFTYIPKELNASNRMGEEEASSPTSQIPIVQSDPEGISSHHLYIALGIGLSLLLVIVCASFILYNYKTRLSQVCSSVRSKKCKNTTIHPSESVQRNGIQSDSAPAASGQSAAHHPLLYSNQSQSEQSDSGNAKKEFLEMPFLAEIKEDNSETAEIQGR